MAASSRRLEGKVAIITGGASGIGEATARLFVANGASVLIADIQDELGLRVAQELGLHVAAYKHCDVTVEADVESTVAMAVSRWGKLDVMFSNAGMIGRGGEGMLTGTMDMEAFDRVMAVNVRGSVLAVKHAAREMLKMKKNSNEGWGGGSIICTGSVCGVRGGLGPLDYTVSKHALVGLVRAAASDVGKHGIRVNAVSPTSVMTPLAVHYAREVLGFPDLPVTYIQSLVDSVNVLSHHTLTPSDVAHAALFLASDESAFVSGLNLLVDGALTPTRSAVKTIPWNPAATASSSPGARE